MNQDDTYAFRLIREMGKRRAARHAVSMPNVLIQDEPAVSTEPLPSKQVRWRPHHRRPMALHFFEIAYVAFLLAALRLAEAWRELPSDISAIVGVLMILIAACGLGFLVLLGWRRRQRRLSTWQRVIAAWQQSRHELATGEVKGGEDRAAYAMHLVLSHFERNRPDRTTAIHFRSVRDLTPRALVDFAAQVYEHIGYGVRAGPRGGIDLHVFNPKGRSEVVVCRQSEYPFGEEDLRIVFSPLDSQPLPRIHLWVPAGFSGWARRWAANKKIFVADEQEIARLIEAGYRSEVAKWSREALID